MRKTLSSSTRGSPPRRDGGRAPRRGYGRRDVTSLGRVDFVEACPHSGDRLQVRMPETVMIAEGGRPNAGAALDDEFDWVATLCVDTRLLQLVRGVGTPIDRNDLGACGDARVESRALPKHLLDPSIRGHVQPDGE